MDQPIKKPLPETPPPKEEATKFTPAETLPEMPAEISEAPPTSPELPPAPVQPEQEFEASPAPETEQLKVKQEGGFLDETIEALKKIALVKEKIPNRATGERCVDCPRGRNYGGRTN